MFKTIVTATALAILPFAASATTVLNFDDGVAAYSGNNNLVGYQVGDLKFNVSHSGANASGANLFNTLGCGTVATCVGTDDGDLLPASQGENGIGGNVLIRQEANRDGSPRSLDDDAAGNGSITFTLLSGPAFRVLGFSAIDDGRFTLTVGGDVLATLAPGADNATAQAVFGTPSTLINVNESFTVNFFGSGAVDSIILAPVPLPAGGVLLLGGLGGLAIMRRRKAAKA